MYIQVAHQYHPGFLLNFGQTGRGNRGKTEIGSTQWVTSSAFNLIVTSAHTSAYTPEECQCVRRKHEMVIWQDKHFSSHSSELWAVWVSASFIRETHLATAPWHCAVVLRLRPPSIKQAVETQRWLWVWSDVTDSTFSLTPYHIDCITVGNCCLHPRLINWSYSFSFQVVQVVTEEHETPHKNTPGPEAQVSNTESSCCVTLMTTWFPDHTAMWYEFIFCNHNAHSRH